MLFIDISEGHPGMLIPLLSSPNTNLPYVQQMDEFLQLREIVPFLQYENYLTMPSEVQRSVTIEDKGLIAFRSYDDSVICGDVSEVMNYIEANHEGISKLPILQCQLNRIVGAELTPSYDVWKSVAAQIFESEAQRTLWVDSELQLFQKQKKRIWSEIDPFEVNRKTPDAGSGIYSSIAEYSTEYLIRWLSNRANFLSKDWTKVWHYVKNKNPFDDRLIEIAQSWIVFISSEGADLQQTFSVLYVLLDRSRGSPNELSGFGEFLSDRMTSDLSILFEAFRYKRLFALLFEFLSKKGDTNDVLKLINFCLDELPKQPFAVAALTSALRNIISETGKFENNLTQVARNRDFDQKQIEYAENLLSALENYAKEHFSGTTNTASV
jgi:hypothetical protein